MRKEQTITDTILQMYKWKKLFWSKINNNKVTYKNILKIATGQGDDYTNSCLLDYIYFRDYYKMIVVD